MNAAGCSVSVRRSFTWRSLDGRRRQIPFGICLCGERSLTTPGTARNPHGYPLVFPFPSRPPTGKIVGVREEDHIASVAARVATELGGALDSAEVEQRVRTAFASMADAPIRDFLPILVEREVLLRVRMELGLRVDREQLRTIVA